MAKDIMQYLQRTDTGFELAQRATNRAVAGAHDDSVSASRRNNALVRDGRDTANPRTHRSPPRLRFVETRFAASPYLSDVERHALEEIAVSPRSVAPNIDLLREDDRAEHFHFMLDGWACRYKTTRDGARQIVALLLPGDAVNLDAFAFGRMDYGVRTFTAVKMISVSRDRLIALADQHPGIVKTLAWLAMTENAALRQWSVRLGRQSAKQKLAHLLCELSVRLGYIESDPDSGFDLPLTQEQIADTLGLTSVHVNRTLRRLGVAGLIAPRHRAMKIVDLDGLRRVGDFDPAYLRGINERAVATFTGVVLPRPGSPAL